MMGVNDLEEGGREHPSTKLLGQVLGPLEAPGNQTHCFLGSKGSGGKVQVLFQPSLSCPVDPRGRTGRFDCCGPPNGSSLVWALRPFWYTTPCSSSSDLVLLDFWYASFCPAVSLSQSCQKGHRAQKSEDPGCLSSHMGLQGQDREGLKYTHTHKTLTIPTI